ncbi:MAG: hypothetical protein II759_02470 [Lachnospiraceae bacterium]|nr:hypothetical protein [Lachnospiraceae bacterium]
MPINRLIHEEEMKKFIEAHAEALYNEQKKKNGVVPGQESPRLAALNTVGFSLTGSLNLDDKTASNGQDGLSFVMAERMNMIQSLRKRDEEAIKKAQQENAGPENNPPEEKIKEIRIDSLMKKFNQEKPEKEIHGRRSVHVGPSKNNPVQNPRSSF